MWHDGDRVRKVHFPHVRESWTQEWVDGDPELNEKQFLAKELRREFKKGR